MRAEISSRGRHRMRIRTRPGMPCNLVVLIVVYAFDDVYLAGLTRGKIGKVMDGHRRGKAHDLPRARYPLPLSTTQARHLHDPWVSEDLCA